MIRFLGFLTLGLFNLTPLFAQPTLSITLDDGITYDRAHYAFKDWNGMILDHLDSAGLKTVFFVKGKGKNTEAGQYLLKSWDDRGHKIANHTYSHPNFNSKQLNAFDFEQELLQTDTIISTFENYVRFFRFPYLKEGNSPEKIDSIRQVLAKHKYTNGHVTIDASDWYIDSRLVKRLKADPNANIEGFKQYYLSHLYERAMYYENLAYELEGRHVKHTLLLHHNLAAALFLDDLITMFRQKGWQVISAEEAFQDPIYKNVTTHAGESLIRAMAKDKGTFEERLRYPAEDSRYEKARMDAFGL